MRPHQGELDYLRAMQDILDPHIGEDKMNRTGVAARGLWVIPMRFDLSKGQFPLLTTKKMAWKGVVAELIGFIKGVDSAADFRSLGTKIWDENANHPQKGKPWVDSPFRRGTDDLGRIYGVQWRRWLASQVAETPAQRDWLLANGWRPTSINDPTYWKEIDQLAELVKKLRTTPTDRRMIVSAWNPGELHTQALPPCHLEFQCNVQRGRLNLDMTQRSCDWFLGVPFNIASYALLTLMLAQVTGYQPGELTITFRDCHIYSNHFEQAALQLTRTAFPAPRVELNRNVKELWDFTTDDVQLLGYESHPAIKAEMS